MNDNFLIRELEEQFTYFLKNVPSTNEVPRSYSEINGIRMASAKYRSKIGTNRGFLLMHSTGNKPKETEVDSSINYTDYYYLEALKRQNEVKTNG